VFFGRRSAGVPPAFLPLNLFLTLQRPPAFFGGQPSAAPAANHTALTAKLRIPIQRANFKHSQTTVRSFPMPVFDEHKDELEHYETMMGPHRGRLAVSLDLLTNALILVGQHGVYCHTNRDPDVPVMDIRIIQAEIGKAKELIQSVMEAMRAERDKKT
jgi:hypothetical protein